jgi:hypothetical protein
METETQTKQPGKKRGPSGRTPLQRAMDLDLIEQLALRGLQHVEIAAEIGKKRGYSISRQMVSYSLAGLAKQWEEAARESFAAAKARALRLLSVVEREAWQAWAAKEKNPTYLTQILNVHDRRARMLGFESPNRIELTGAGGGAIELHADSGPINEARRLEILKRHICRLEEAQKRELTDATEAPALVEVKAATG